MKIIEKKELILIIKKKDSEYNTAIATKYTLHLV